MSDEKRKGTRIPQLSYQERKLIEYWWNEDRLSQSEIAKRLRRSQSVISRELRRGATKNISDLKPQMIKEFPHYWLEYSANRGQFQADTHQSVNIGPSKLTYDTQKQIEHYLNIEKWAPEDIVERLNLDVAATSIRIWIAKGYIKADKNALGRPRKRKGANGRGVLNSVRDTETDKIIEEYGDDPDNYDPIAVRKKRAQRIRNHAARSEYFKKIDSELHLLNDSDLVDPGERKSIHSRPASVDKRRDFGHWEADLVMSRHKTSNHPVMVLIERKTRFTVIERVNSKKFEDIAAAFDHFMMLYHSFVKSITMDNGTEFSSATIRTYLQEAFHITAYYSDSSSPWQRGTNEWKNKQMRFMMRTAKEMNPDFRRMTQVELDRIAELQNNKPMLKALNGKTPNEAFAYYSKRWLSQHKHTQSKLDESQ